LIFDLIVDWRFPIEKQQLPIANEIVNPQIANENRQSPNRQ
jgi:hypothetical protein